jgi:hypothetical protein
MKKLVFTAIAVFSLTFVNAQEEKQKESKNGVGFTKGDVFLTGSLGLHSYQDDQKGFNVAPSLGYFVSENIAIGTRVGYFSRTFENSSLSKVDNISADVFGRYYFKPSATFSIFTELNAGFFNSTVETINNNITSTYKSDGFRAGINPGISYFVSNHFAIEANFGLLNFTSNNPDSNGGPTTNNINFGLNLSSLNFGLIYKL